MNRRLRMLGVLACFGVAWVETATAGPPRPAQPAEIADWIAASGDSASYGGASTAYLLDEADVFVDENGLATTRSCVVFKILTESAVRSQSVQRFEFDPAANRIKVDSVRIYRADGAVEDVDVSRIVTQPARQRIIFWGNRQHLLSLPGLRVGDCVELRTTKVGFNIAYLADGQDGAGGGIGGRERRDASDAGELQPPMPGHWYDVVLFQGAHPIDRKRYSVHMPADKPLQYEVYNGPLKSSLWFDGDAHVYTFEAHDVAAVRREPHMVAYSDCVPKVVMATVPDWRAKSRWFHEANLRQFEADDAIRDKVRALLAGAEDEEERISRLLHWTADNVRYYGTSRGPCEGFTLHKGTETFRDRGGVCKDKAGMLVTMLRAAGFEAYPALTMAGSRVEEIPADQFNHSVTVLRTRDGGFRVLDPTWSPQSKELWSSREALQGLVYGTPDGEELTLSPYFPPEYNLLHAQADSRISADGSLRCDLEMNLKGYPCTYLRRTVGRERPSERRTVFERSLRIAPNARIDRLDFVEPTDYSRDSFVTLSAEAPDFAAAGGARAMFKLPLMAHPLGDFLMPDLLYSVDAESRTYAMRMRATRLVRYDERIELPDGWEVQRLPKPVDIDTPAASVHFQAEVDAGAIKYVFEARVIHHIITPEQYPGFRKAMLAMRGLSDEWVVCSTNRQLAGGSAGSTPGAGR